MPLYKLPAPHWAGRWMGGGKTVFREASGEQRAWRRTGVLLASKGKENAPSLPGGWQDEPEQPQLLLPLCWEGRSSGEPGPQPPPIHALAVVGKGLEPPASNKVAHALQPLKPGRCLRQPGQGKQTLPLLPSGSLSGERCSAEAKAFRAQISLTGLNLRF